MDVLAGSVSLKLLNNTGKTLLGRQKRYTEKRTNLLSTALFFHFPSADC